MSMDQPTTLEVPKLSDMDVQWLRGTIGIKDPRVSEWESADYARVIDDHLYKKPQCRLSDKNADGNTPLHLVAISENYAAIEALLMCGADVNERNNAGHTPITYSHACPDYNVGFQFFRHLHKLACLGHYIDQENSIWNYDVRKTYDQRYPRTGYLAAFMHNPSLDKETICKIADKGVDTIFDMYDQELQKIQNTRMHRSQRLGVVVSLTTQDDIAENCLKRLKHFIKCCYFHKNFPLFGCLIKQKYRQSLERVKSRQIGEQDLSHARNLRNKEERRNKEFMTRRDAVMNGLMSGSRNIKLEHDCGTSDFSKAKRSQIHADNLNTEEEKIERMRNLLAKLPRPGLSS